ncbi:hypothetical protein [Guptibacillus spartinae]|uniref:hypothetical protein n=1 Tax=Guptibacillus spartinae TaxID=3025679 RepID=UPI00235EFF32|nr:hypothetical protein [Pseudalkalibacillus spartinae]
MNKRNWVFIAIIAAIGVITVTTLMVMNSQESNNENKLLKPFDLYMNKNNLSILEIHQKKDYIFSLYSKGENFGVIEYSKDNISKENSNENSNSEKVSHVFLSGKYNNYLGIKINHNPENVGFAEVIANGDSMKYTINDDKNSGERNDILIDTKYSKKEIDQVKIYKKNGDKVLYRIDFR